MHLSMKTSALAAIVGAALALPACGAAMYERETARDLRAAEAGLGPAPGDMDAHDVENAADAEARALPAPDGSLAAYEAHALRGSPEMRAAFEAWRAQRLRIAQARRLPEPTLSYGYFLRSVETRVGPQRQRIGLSQPIPWPGKLDAGADAAAAAARAAQARFQARALAVRQRVAEAYWQLWLVRRTRDIQQEQKQIMQALAASLRGRLEVGKASLADLAQLDLSISRVDDALIGLDEDERAASARLVAAIGAPPGTATPTTDAPPAGGVPATDEHALRQAALAHPSIQALARMAEAQDAQARRARAERYPDFGVGIDYIDTGDAAMPDMPDSGKDPIVAMFSVKLPLWQRSYADAADAARAEGAALRAQEQAARDRVAFEVAQSLARLRDAARRIDLYTSTLIPQAETVYGSVVGAYETDRQPISSVLLAERDLLELRLGLARARRDHAMARAMLEELIGRPVDLTANPRGAPRSGRAAAPASAGETPGNDTSSTTHNEVTP